MIRLTVERKKLGLSQARLAALTGTMHPSSISEIESERRKPGFKQSYLITEALKGAGWDGEGSLFDEVRDECDE